MISIHNFLNKYINSTVHSRTLYVCVYISKQNLVEAAPNRFSRGWWLCLYRLGKQKSFWLGEKSSLAATKLLASLHLHINMIFQIVSPTKFYYFFFGVMQCNLDQSHPKIWIDILSNQTLNAYYTTPSSRVALSAWRLHCIRALFSLENDDTHARKPMSSSSGLRSSERAGGLSLSRGYCIILVLGHGAFSIGWCFKHSSEGKKAVRSPDKLSIHLKSSLPPLP